MNYRIYNLLTFIHVPKTGGTSISRWIQGSSLEFGKLFNEEHVSFILIDDRWKNNLFAVIRNPYDRLVSYYYHFGNMVYNKRDNGEMFAKQYEEWQKGFKHYVFGCKYLTFRKTAIDSNFPFADGSQWISNPQIKYIGKDLTNFTLMKFENLDHDFKLMQNKLNDFRPLTIENATNQKSLVRKNWEDYYDQETKDEVYHWWKDDFELLGYEK